MEVYRGGEGMNISTNKRVFCRYRCADCHKVLEEYEPHKSLTIRNHLMICIRCFSKLENKILKHEIRIKRLEGKEWAK